MLETAAVRALTDLRARDAAEAMRSLLDASPLSGWREGIERGALVRELVGALGTLRDEASAPHVLQILEATSNEYKHVVPVAAWAAGRLRHLPALDALERIALSRKEPVGSETVWAIGELGASHPSARRRATALLAALPGVGSLEPGVEIVRLTGLAKANAGTPEAPRTRDVRAALEHALWDPAFRQEETSRRQAWAFRSLAELARVWREGHAGRARDEDDAFFLGHEAVRYFTTRDDHRVRTSAQAAFAAWGAPLPRTRRYYAFVLDAIEQRGGLEALHDAVRDPLGIFRHNVATRLAERGHPSSVRPLAEATARLFAEPPTSTYEYDDAPLYLVTFVRALARLNRPEGNAVLLDGLRSAHHHVRAVIADNAPDDPAFVPELRAMLGDPRSFLRSRAERSLRALGASPKSASESPPRTAPL
jgi:HEAT repeat protein